MRTDLSGRAPIRFTLAGQSYPEPSPYDRLILEELVRYVGDEVAIIAAGDEKNGSKGDGAYPG